MSRARVRLVVCVLAAALMPGRARAGGPQVPAGWPPSEGFWPQEIIVALNSVRLEHDSVTQGDVAVLAEHVGPTLGGGGVEAVLEPRA
ncbi:MAG: hypothetical protein HY744_26450, partial [Deltaproteobacteria bacterium]|nr:hypothetical protein [Deltaproteobacteria bacterium]